MGEDTCISLVSYIITRTHKLDKWIKHWLVLTLGSSRSQKKIKVSSTDEIQFRKVDLFWTCALKSL